MNERVAVLGISVALATLITWVVVYAMRAMAAMGELGATLGNLPPP